MFLIEDQEFKKRSAIDWTRVKRDREGGQPKPPYGPGSKTSRAKLIYFKLLLEMLYY